MRKSAFTLIELLVVIAIIAILAAILFPVFAQAKAAAKSIASVSNAKQISLGTIMYMGDSDSTYPLEQIWNADDAQLTYGGKCGAFSPWTYEVLPYIKSGQIFEDPQIQTAGTNPFSAYFGNDVWYAYNPEYAYNYAALSPWSGTPGAPASCGFSGSMEAVTEGQVSTPASTLLATATQTGSEAAFQWWGPGVPLPWFSINPPDGWTNPTPDYIESDWGVDGYFAQWIHTPQAGQFSGGVSLRRGNQSVSLFCDGHAKQLSQGALAAGTNWAPGIAAGVAKQTNASTYLWGTQQQ